MPKLDRTKKFTKLVRDQVTREHVLRYRQNDTNQELPSLVETSETESEDEATIPSPYTHHRPPTQLKFEEKSAQETYPLTDDMAGGTDTEPDQAAAPKKDFLRKLLKSVRNKRANAHRNRQQPRSEPAPITPLAAPAQPAPPPHWTAPPVTVPQQVPPPQITPVPAPISPLAAPAQPAPPPPWPVPPVTVPQQVPPPQITPARKIIKRSNLPSTQATSLIKPTIEAAAPLSSVATPAQPAPPPPCPAPPVTVPQQVPPQIPPARKIIKRSNFPSTSPASTQATNLIRTTLAPTPQSSLSAPASSPNINPAPIGSTTNSNVSQVQQNHEEKTDRLEKYCASPGCNKATNLHCPTCITLGIKGSFFCTQQCFKSNWNLHKNLHKLGKSDIPSQSSKEIESAEVQNLQKMVTQIRATNKEVPFDKLMNSLPTLDSNGNCHEQGKHERRGQKYVLLVGRREQLLPYKALSLHGRLW